MFFRTDRPDMHTSRVAWEKSWEQDMDKSYRRGGPLNMPNVTFASILPPDAVALLASDSSLLQTEVLKRSICKLQEDLAKEAAASFAEDAFEERWLALPNEKRRNFILEGIYRTMCLPDMDERRKWCPDSTLNHLASGNGKTYLRMLKGLMPTDLLQPISEPIKIEHPIMDRLFSLSAADMKKPGMKAMAQSYTLSRTYCLTLIIWNIILAVQGKEENQVPAKPTGSKANNAAVREFFKDVPDASDVSKKHRKVVKDLGYACWSCGKNEKMLPPDAKLMACSKCRTIDRKVWYCSRECQVEDWKHGRPRPHKLICGKPLDEEHTGSPASNSTPADTAGDGEAEDKEDDLDKNGIPPPDPGYKRSPALLHQISLLSEHPELDYVLVRPYPHPDHGVTFTDALGRMFFWINRTRAFRNGEPQSVRMMFSMLSDSALANGVSRADVQRQMENEYPGVRLDDVPWNDAPRAMQSFP